MHHFVIFNTLRLATTNELYNFIKTSKTKYIKHDIVDEL